MNSMIIFIHTTRVLSCLVCPICKSEPGTQEHALKCFAMKKHMQISELEALQAVDYNYIFGDIEAQSKVTQVFESVIILREKLCQVKKQNVAYRGSNSVPSG